MTATDLIAFTRLAVSETEETLSDAQILRLINQSYIELAAAVDFPELVDSADITLAASTAEYEIGSGDDDFLYVNDVVDTTNNLQLREINLWQYNQYTQGSTTLGNPVYWLITGLGANSRRQFTFFPTPSSSGTVTIHYRKKPADLIETPSPTSSVLPPIWDDSILHRAISRSWRVLGDLTKSSQWMQAVRESDKIALSVSLYASRVPQYSGSIVGQALR